MKKNLRCLYLLVLVVTLVLLELLMLPTMAFAKVVAGTTLEAEKTVAAFGPGIIYDWTIEKKVNPDTLELKKDETDTVTYTIEVKRNVASQSTEYGVGGTITVTNGGDQTTENLKMVDRVQYKTGSGKFQDLSGASQTIIASSQLEPGETGKYSYEITFNPVPSAVYRNVVKVTITNQSGHLGEEWGPEPKADFNLPEGPVMIDEEADVSDVQNCPTGFECSPSDPGPWHFTESDSVTFTKDIKNISAEEGTYELNNNVTLVESDSKQNRTGTAKVTISVVGGGQQEVPQVPGMTGWGIFAGVIIMATLMLVVARKRTLC